MLITVYEFSKLLVFFKSTLCISLIDHLWKYQKVITSWSFLYKLLKEGVIAKIIHKHK